MDIVGKSLLEENAGEGESPSLPCNTFGSRNTFLESRFLGVKRKVGGKLYLRLNILWETDSK